VQAAGDFVVGGIELAAGVQLGEHHLRGGHRSPSGRSIMSTGMPRPSSTTVMELSTWMTTSIFLGVAGERFIDGVVDDFVDEVMQTHLAGRADVHGGAQADGFKAFKNLDVFAGVAVVIAVLHGGAARTSVAIEFRSQSVPNLEGRRG
jgi:hypothetical protein